MNDGKELLISLAKKAMVCWEKDIAHSLEMSWFGFRALDEQP
jgi:hypothetical protein